ncbi:relaxase/mobilization nuclease domain-containing protein [Alkaliphilus sp. MSJ-5]|uniref:Relaxase/mobilization nuclease domain-containing protein n=1 Tax=Alkaliphilus flagellatus TaxID=2841507 RepID=A0ABS6G358_9FIRM|nr:relaxase/mobilization nuclease domain-containing protein [Alkaliphilus flagellatus]MBU5676912.1 relaxase/mobilization nuclease domain-containing protein [Alkaliphilus flagellatus]
MGIVKFINGSNKKVQGLVRAIDYIVDENKTEVFTFENLNVKDEDNMNQNNKDRNWQYNLFAAVKKNKDISKSKEEFIKNMSDLGYQVKWEDNRKYITFTTPDGHVRRNNKLYPAQNFTKEALENIFSLNKSNFEKGIKINTARIKKEHMSELDKEMTFVEKLISEDKGNRAINYITKDGKTSAKLITGINCSPESAFDEMMVTKKMFNKEKGRQFIHFIHSFHPYEDISPELAHEISLKLIEQERFKEFEILVATHTDKDHLHTHFILNTVNYETGVKWQQSIKEAKELISYSDKLCEEYGLKYSVSNKKRRANTKSETIGERKAREEGRSWKHELQLAARNVLKYSRSKEEFIKNMSELGYQVKWDNDDNNITFTTSNGRPCSNLSLYPPENFTKEAMEKRFALNKQYEKITNNSTLQKQFDEREEIVLQTVKMLESNPSEGHKDYPRSYLEGQALKEKIKEKEKGEGLDWER